MTDAGRMSRRVAAASVYEPECRRCPRLAGFLADLRQRHPDYHCRPVAPFGDENALLLIVGLAPGMHGANRTGRPFTGDHAGIILYEMLYEYGFSTHPASEAADDGLILKDCRITNAVKCLPPGNKPSGAEINTCNDFLAAELATLDERAVVLALGGIAHRAVIRAVDGRQSEHAFAHAAVHDIAGRFRLLDSYHCSRYNTNTGRLTPGMFRAVFARARELVDQGAK